MSTVPGDPASVSACAGTARAVAARLAERAGGVHTASAELADGWPGRRSAAIRRRAAPLAEAALATAKELERVGGVLQDHSTDLADLVARGRAVEERATAGGLTVRDGRVEVAWGVTGTADVSTERERDDLRAALQGELDLVLAQHRRRRDWVLRVLRDSTAVLAQTSRNVRDG